MHIMSKSLSQCMSYVAVLILTGTHIIIITLTADSKIHIKSKTPFSCFCSFLSSPDTLVSNKWKLHYDMPIAVHGYIIKMQCNRDKKSISDKPRAAVCFPIPDTEYLAHGFTVQANVTLFVWYYSAFLYSCLRQQWLTSSFPSFFIYTGWTFLSPSLSLCPHSFLHPSVNLTPLSFSVRFHLLDFCSLVHSAEQEGVMLQFDKCMFRKHSNYLNQSK